MHKWADVLLAIADGKEVQYKSSNGLWIQMVWNSDVSPISHPELEWRIKPEPKPTIVRDMQIVVYDDESSDCFRLPVVPVRIVLDGDTKKPISVELIK